MKMKDAIAEAERLHQEGGEGAFLAHDGNDVFYAFVDMPPGYFYLNHIIPATGEWHW
jgi:hypothetical protein|tara:strand:- start:5311 stop:5481 length:171 start_codon:yes stop_codon:yes gene_type:complete